MVSFVVGAAIVVVVLGLLVGILYKLVGPLPDRPAGLWIPDMPNIPMPPPPTEVRRQVPTHYWLDIGNEERIRLTLYRVEASQSK